MASEVQPSGRCGPPAAAVQLGGDGDDVLTRLRAAFDLKIEPVARELTFLDTFDWRLGRSGRYCWAEKRGSGYLLRVSEPGRTTRRLLVPSLPRFASDLPQSPSRQAIAGRCGGRCLLEVVTVRERGRLVRVTDGEGKVRVRVFLGETCPARRGGGASPLVRVEPLRGYERDAAAVRAALALDPAPIDEPRATLERALEAVGRRCGDYTSRLSVDLAPELPAGEAVRLVLADLLDTLRRNEGGVIAAWDSEFLHDFRVAVRRTRSIESELTGIHDFGWAGFKDEFRWLGSVTGPVRDLDVHLEDLHSPEWVADPVLGPALGLLEPVVERQHAAAHAALVEALGSPRYRRLVGDWEAFLASPRAVAGTEVDRPVREFASERIWRAYRRVRRRGRTIDSGSADGRLHELRIRCKRLRYLLESFRSLYPQRSIRPLVAVQKRLQENLGRFNDLAVQIETLRHTALALDTGSRQEVEALMAIGRFAERLARRQRAERGRFAKMFSEFDRPRTRARFRELFGQ